MAAQSRWGKRMGPPAHPGCAAPCQPHALVLCPQPIPRRSGGQNAGSRAMEPGGSEFASWLSHLLRGEVPRLLSLGPYLSNGGNDNSHLAGLL